MATDVRSVVFNTGANSGWVTALHNALAAVGLVQTADTGQINLASPGTSGAYSTSLGYEIWRFNDTLQATAPVFIRVEYGNGIQGGGGSGFIPTATWMTVGTGTNGAGTLTGIVSTRVMLNGWIPSGGGGASPNVNNYTKPVWTSGAANRIGQCILREGTTAVGGDLNVFWAVERTKDAAGNDTGEGVHIVAHDHAGGASGSGTIGANWRCQTMIFSIATAQALANAPMCMVNHDGTGTDAGNTGIFPWQMASKRGNENPPMGWLSYFYGDIAGSVDFIVSVYGSNHTYRSLGGDAGQGASNGVYRAGWRPSSALSAIQPAPEVQLAMRWE